MADTALHSMTQNTDPQATDEIYLLDSPASSPVDCRIQLEMLWEVINTFTEDTAPQGNAEYLATYKGSVTQARKVLLRRIGSYALETGSWASNNPADATTYYMGSFPALTMNSASAAGRRMYLPYPGIITAVDVQIVCTGGGTGTSETSTLYVRVNNTTDTTVTTAIALNATPYHELVTGLAVSLVNANDYFEFKWVTPTWATNPTGVYVALTAFIAQSG